MAMRIRTPRRRKTKSIGQVGQGRRATPAKLTETPAPKRRKPTATPARAMPIPAKAKKRKPIGYLGAPKLVGISPRDLPKPTSAQKAAMRKQKIAKYGNAAKRRRMVDTATKRAVRQGMATPGQIRSYKSTNQKIALGRSMPKRTTKRTSRRLV